MQKNIQQWLDEYGISHRNRINKIIHWICVPAIMFSLLGLLWSIPFPWGKTWFSNWAGFFLIFSLAFYLRLSVNIFLGFIPVGMAMLYGVNALKMLPIPVWESSLIIFTLAWTGQFIGHKIEGEKPSFFKDLQFLLIGPAWLLHFIYKKAGIKY